MPIKIPDKLPAKAVLQAENIFVMDVDHALRQDIRALKICVVNLMPLKHVTEVQLLRLLGNTPLQIEVTLLHMESHASKNTAPEHLSAFYRVFREVKHRRFDGMIITGAPVETLPFEAVLYWPELCEIMAWSRENVTSVLHICWGAQAGLYFHYGIPKYPLERKMFGVFRHELATGASSDILRGFDASYFAPHSRHTEVRRTDILAHPDLRLLSESPEAGVYIVTGKDGRRQIFVTGHSEYDPLTLKEEYDRDLARGDAIALPANYFPGGDPTRPPEVTWRAHANLLFCNWLNYCVYQETPYEI